MGVRAIALSAVALAFIFLQSGPTGAQSSKDQESPIGKVATLEGSASIQRKVVVAAVTNVSGLLEVKAGDLVYLGDLVHTAPASKLGLVFADGTALNVFSDAQVELNEFVYVPEGKRNSSVFNLVKGTFTVIGGKMARTGEMRMNTAVATLGIRGTAAHIVVGDDGSVRFSTLVEEKH